MQVKQIKGNAVAKKYAAGASSPSCFTSATEFKTVDTASISNVALTSLPRISMFIQLQILTYLLPRKLYRVTIMPLIVAFR